MRKKHIKKTILKNVSRRKIYINLPSTRQQTDYTCGAAALRAIAKYYGKDLNNENEFEILCRSGRIKGAHPEDIVKAARELGLYATMEEFMSVDNLINYITRKIPVICAIQAWGDQRYYNKLKDGHYVVAIGFDNKNIYFEDPSITGSRPYLSKEEFYKRWIDREAYVDNPVKVRLGIMIRGGEPKKKKVLTKTRRLP